MATEKIKITVKTPEVLEQLGYKENITLEIDLPANKTTFNLLSNSDEIIDWEILNEPTPDSGNTIDMNLNSFNNLATYLEAVFRICRKSPAMIFGSEMFNAEVKKEYEVVGSEPISIDHAIVNMVLESYYLGTSDFNEIQKDINEKIKTNWNQLSQLHTVGEVANVFFRTK